MPQFSRQSTRTLSPAAYLAAVRRGRKLLDQIEQLAVPLDTREKQQLTRAINGLAYFARDLARRQRGLSVAEELHAQSPQI
jgi:hypothetical protein